MVLAYKWNLEPTWQISQIRLQGDNSSFFPLQPNQEAYTKLHFKLPETDGYKQAKETLKLFATKGLANFQWLILPSLDNGLETKGNLNLQLRSKAEELRTRGEVQTINPLNNLLSAIGADVDHPPQITRAMVYRLINGFKTSASCSITLSRETPPTGGGF